MIWISKDVTREEKEWLSNGMQNPLCNFISSVRILYDITIGDELLDNDEIKILL